MPICLYNSAPRPDSYWKQQKSSAAFSAEEIAAESGRNDDSNRKCLAPEISQKR